MDSAEWFIIIVSFLIGVVIGVLITIPIDNIHREIYLYIERTEIVKQGYAEWSYDKKFMIKPEYLKYYELKGK